MKKNQSTTCIKSGLPLSSPSVCAMCRRSCRLAGNRGKRYSANTPYPHSRKTVHQSTGL